MCSQILDPLGCLLSINVHHFLFLILILLDSLFLSCYYQLFLTFYCCYRYTSTMADKLELPLHSKGKSSSRKKVYSLFIGINFILILCTLFSYGSDKANLLKLQLMSLERLCKSPMNPIPFVQLSPK